MPDQSTRGVLAQIQAHSRSASHVARSVLALVIGHKFITYLVIQIEQFIESIFPSQKPGQVATPAASLTAAEAEKRAAEEKEAKWDMIYLTIAVMGFLTFLTLLMVTFLLPIIFERLLTITGRSCVSRWRKVDSTYRRCKRLFWRVDGQSHSQSFSYRWSW